MRLYNLFFCWICAGMLMLLNGCAGPAWEKAIRKGDIAEVAAFLKNDDFLRETTSFSHGFARLPFLTPLMVAAEENNIELIKVFLDRGANPNVKVPILNCTALSWAAKRNNREASLLLINRGASVDEALAGLETIKLKMATEHAQEASVGIKFLQRLANERNTLPPPPVPTVPIKIPQPVITVQSDIDTNIPTGKPAGKFDVAVVIGNHTYSSSGTPNVDYALNDARTMREYLTKALGYDPANIIYLENATLTKLYEVFGTKDDHRGKLFKWVKPGQSRVFIYYVGHGAPDQESGEAYFVPVDANPQYIRTGGYKLSTFYENISKIPAAKKTVVIDACFSGSSPNGQLLKGVSGLVARMKSEPKAASAADLLFASAGMDQVSSWYPEKGHSLFTYFFLKGLQGEADTNKDGKISMAEMKAYLNDQVPYMARRLTGNEQQPQFIGNETDEVSTYAR